jgi:hypothetical protein
MMATATAGMEDAYVVEAKVAWWCRMAGGRGGCSILTIVEKMRRGW